MPATEQTWRDSKRMHVVFGISSLLMLVTTIWMLAADHRREWKHFQRTFRDVETRQHRSSHRSSRTTSSTSRSWQTRKAELAAAQREVPPAGLIDEFAQMLMDAEAEAARRHAGRLLEPIDKPTRNWSPRPKRPKAEPSEEADKRRRRADELIRRARTVRGRRQVPREQLPPRKEIRRPPTSTSIAASTRSASATNCPESSSTELEDEVDRRPRTRSTSRIASVEAAKTQRQQLERVVGRDHGRRKPRPARPSTISRASSISWKRPTTSGATTSAKSCSRCRSSTPSAGR